MKAGRMLRYARRLAGLTQRELAVRAGVPQATVGRIESGQITPRLDTLEKLLRAVGQSLTLEAARGMQEDRGMIRDRLRMSPGERARLAVREARAFSRLGRPVSG
ncbi:MAG: helix-turn-helix transcriptional regulator [Chloroflexota bacterium]